jgi:acetylornithine deacetylase/succinyl-diaminopimelate desuccinylase-like protein
LSGYCAIICVISTKPERDVTEPALISTDRLMSDLDQLLSLPGSPGEAEELAAVATRVASLMRGHGLHVTTVATPGAPVVIGRRAGRHPFSLLLFHHYDAMPSGPWRAWHHEPFQLAEREGMLYGRGVADGKGPLAAHLSAIRSLLDAERELPCGVVVVAEGESLTGSPGLGAAVASAHSLLKADACLASGGERDAADRPFCYTGAKGLLQVRLRASGANQALPPGMAASVANPLWRLLWALGHVKSDQEEVLIEGFYDDVEGPSRTENQALRSLSMDEGGRKRAWGIAQFLFDLDGAALVRTEGTLPTCNVTDLAVEPSSDLPIIPVAATARVDFQLVPRQHPQAISDRLRAHLANKGMADIAVERLPGGYPAVHTPFEHPFVQRLRAVGEQLYTAPLPLLPQGPFAQPLFFFAEAFGIPVAALGCARADSAMSAPNEHIPLADLIRHGQLLIDLLYACAEQPAEGPF